MIYLRTFIVLFFFGINYYVVSGKDGDQLKAVVVLYRHGDRSPLRSWPNDIYFGNSSLWPDGYGQLNNLGKERHYKLGQWFRERYDGFLPKRYNCSDIYVRSTDVDRTLMSAASNLAGLYPPEDDQVWNSAIPWQAIPIHTIPKLEDPILTHVPCPKHDRLEQELMNSEEFQKLNLELADLYKNISELTGIPSVDLNTFSLLFTTINIYKGYNLTLPDWIEYYWPEIEMYAAKHFQLHTYTDELARLRAGPFLDYLLSYFEDFNGGNSVKSKFLMLSAHDSTIGDRTNAMGVYPGAVPEFASTVIWELKNNGQIDYVNMYFKNSTDFSKLVLPGCSFDCSLSEYASLLEPLRATVDQWTIECNEV
ncbi:unnamed protein product [Ceutorhynchus assimilis]|uniref:acid phosphatase n=1 Tax=Ceutorhynchus assimilis TaxID=467358 RepID=A0A9N9MU07_9CUCU|nr:unnamed protein product [Ceutorhynchus assimilis]